MVNLIFQFTNIKLRAVKESVKDSTNKSNYRKSDLIKIKAPVDIFLSPILKSTHENMTFLLSKDITNSHPLFNATMSRTWYEILVSVLRIDDPAMHSEHKVTDKVTAISEIFNKLIVNSQNVFCPSSNLTNDEMLIQFHQWEVWLLSLHAEKAYGIKVMCLADATISFWYNVYIYIYSGKKNDGIGPSENEKKLMVPTQSVNCLCKPIEG